MSKTKTKTNIGPIRQIGLITILFCVLTISQAQIVFASGITSEKMIDLINRSRAEAGVSSLAVNSQLSSAAKAKAEDMFRFQYFDHTSPSGTTPWHWIREAGYEYSYAGENLAIDFVTAEGAHKALMESSSHQRNILNSNYSEIGVAAMSDIFEETKSIIIVEMFGSPREKTESESYKSIAAAKEPEINAKEGEAKSAEIFPSIKAVILEEEGTGEIEKTENENVARDNAMYDPELRICKAYDFKFINPAFKFAG